MASQCIIMQLAFFPHLIFGWVELTSISATLISTLNSTVSTNHCIVCYWGTIGLSGYINSAAVNVCLHVSSCVCMSVSRVEASSWVAKSGKHTSVSDWILPNCSPGCLSWFTFSTAVDEYLFPHVLANAWCYQI